MRASSRLKYKPSLEEADRLLLFCRRARQNPLCEPAVIYPDFLREPLYTDWGAPFVTMMQDACDNDRGVAARTPDTMCAECQYLIRGQEWLAFAPARIAARESNRIARERCFFASFGALLLARLVYGSRTKLVLTGIRSSPFPRARGYVGTQSFDVPLRRLPKWRQSLVTDHVHSLHGDMAQGPVPSLFPFIINQNILHGSPPLCANLSGTASRTGVEPSCPSVMHFRIFRQSSPCKICAEISVREASAV